MLGIGGKFASAKGMVRVPDITGLTAEEADLAIALAGLRRSRLISSGTTQLFSLNNRIDSQTVLAGQLVDYETEISYRSLAYVAPPPPAAPPPVITLGPCEEYRFDANGTFCIGQQTCSGGGVSQRRAKVLSNGVWSGGYSECASFITGSSCSFVNGSCGYTAPVVCNGTPGSNTFQSSCSGGQYYITTRSWDACGKESRTTRYFSCCTAGLVSCTSWSGSAGGQSRTCTYRRSDCSTYTSTETRCSSSSSTTCGSCVRIGGLVGSFKSCTTTTTFSNCTTSRTTSSVKC